MIRVSKSHKERYALWFQSCIEPKKHVQCLLISISWILCEIAKVGVFVLCRCFVVITIKLREIRFLLFIRAYNKNLNLSNGSNLPLELVDRARLKFILLNTFFFLNYSDFDSTVYLHILDFSNKDKVGNKKSYLTTNGQGWM